MADIGEAARPTGHGPDQDRTLQRRVQTFLGEFRVIIPAMGVLLGFQLTSAFQASFDELSGIDKAVNFAGLSCSVLALLFLLMPASYHRFMAGAKPTRGFLDAARRSIGLAFVFMPLAIAASLYVQAVRTFGGGAVAWLAAGLALLAFALVWWVWPWAAVEKDPDVQRDP